MAKEINLKGGTDRADLAIAWQDRMKDAEVLHAAGRNAAAITLALYSIEIYLKVRICKILDIEKLPIAFQIHDLEALLILCGLSNHLNGKLMLGSPVKQNWDLIIDQSRKLMDLRYLPDVTYTSNNAKDVLAQLNDSRDGVLTWLQNQP